ncbi:MAG: hypothetical protein BRD21_09335, partial [Halobacteriales archaeon SW_8_66_22]
TSASFDVVPSGAQLIESVDGTATTYAGGSGLEFDVENTGSRSIEITDFAVEYSGANKLRNLTAPEVEILGGGTDGTASSIPGFDVDNTTYALDTNAVVQAGQQATIRLSEFQGGGFSSLTSVTLTDSSNADLTVTLTFGDGSKRVYYLKVET